ncbi:RNA-binding protein 45 [Polypterus senegalus]
MDENSFRADEPPNSRLFVVTCKSTAEEVIRQTFAQFEGVQNISTVKDKHTKEYKGVAFVKFAKSSQACLAMEEMHGKCLTEGTKPIKVFIAQSRGSGSHRDLEDEDLTRIFVMIPKSYTEEDLRDSFQEYGDIEYCVILKDRSTGESRGLGYVRFLKPSQAALAIENCDRDFRAILAEPKNKAQSSTDYEGFGNSRTEHVSHDVGMNTYSFAESSNFGMSDMRRESSETITKCLLVSSRGSVTQEQLFSLFDIIPGMDYCEMQRDPYVYYKGQAVIRYNNVGSAVYAKEKLDGFEYPTGNRLSISYVDDGEDRSSPVGTMALQLVAAQMMSMVWSSPSGQQLIKNNSGFSSGSSSHVPRFQTDAVLPSRKVITSDSRVKERLFVVFNPVPLSIDILEDIFSRFGNLIEAYVVPGRNVGYIKYADRKSASDAIAALHGKVVNGVRLKVMPADPQKEESHKRQRTY